ncbi:MAG: proton-conducting transporter membrane subunit [Bacteroidales bacterium]|jgi:formate hydrogenlyase subunit 3/multisubunit Na+/H+ antiporter MnhD subunit|nr:proton-conducting transporter membrane subunit [Bacteroidales bacterium]
MNNFMDIFSQPSVCNLIQLLIILPVAAGLALFIIPARFERLKGLLALAVSLLAGCMSLPLFNSAVQMVALDAIAGRSCSILTGTNLSPETAVYLAFTLDGLSKTIILFISLFVILVLAYSLVYIRKVRVKDYFSWILITAGCSYGAALADNLILFLIFWGILGITLYKLIPGRDEDSSAAAKKTLIIIGASDTIMLAGIALLWRLTGSTSMNGISLPTDNLLNAAAFLALIAGSFTKAGAFPFHTWIPDYAREAPASSSALLPASLDKLLGIYFLARITTGLFEMGEWMRFLLMAAGAITIIVAVMMALVQHDCRKLLGFHAVSQVGYMVLGFGLSSAIGVAAGLFHMINNALYKSGLFLSAGCVEYRTGKKTIDELGGLSGAMPVTFISSLIFAMSISGVPPFNGFASKWMIYQGIIESGTEPGIAGRLWMIWLGLAVLGSALTLASFIKFIGGIYLGRKKPAFEKITEAPVIMWIPVAVLAFLCVLFGVFATNFIVPQLLIPASGDFEFPGFWNSTGVSILVLLSLALGALIYLATGIKRFRTEDSFIGGEQMQDRAGYPTPEFYKTLGEFPFFSWMYRKAEEKLFDIYELSKKFVLWFSHQLSVGHSGELPGYIMWVFAGLIIMLLIMI